MSYVYTDEDNIENKSKELKEEEARLRDNELPPPDVTVGVVAHPSPEGSPPSDPPMLDLPSSDPPSADSGDVRRASVHTAQSAETQSVTSSHSESSLLLNNDLPSEVSQPQGYTCII